MSTPGLIQILVAYGVWSEDSYQVVRADICFRVGNWLDVERLR
jgi:hypothetical protein